MGGSLQFPHFLMYLKTSISSKTVRETFLSYYSKKGNKNVKIKNYLLDMFYNFLDVSSHFC